MTTANRFKTYFEHGFTITEQEQADHDKLVKKVQREHKRFIKYHTDLLIKRFETLRRKNENKI